MDNSMNISMSKSSQVSPYEGVADDDETPEESSWTMYFEDYSNNKNNIIDEMNGNSCFSNSDMNYKTSSLVSDVSACNSAARTHGFGASLIDYNHKSFNRLSFMKRKTKGSTDFVDDDLEDTASSPANSPKVCNLENHFDKNVKQKDDISQEEIKGSGNSGEIDERNEDLGFLGRENNGTELQKKGLCLVPLSMAVKYLG